MKIFMLSAVLIIVGCGVQEQRTPIGGTRDLVSKKHRLYAQKLRHGYGYCVRMKNKRNKSTELLTAHGSLSEKQLKKLLRDRAFWQVFGWHLISIDFFADEIRVREDRFAALLVRDAHTAITAKRFNAIVDKIRSAEPDGASSSCGLPL